ncbi:unnamed protein product [Blepharisma stoltei]|uniref:3'-5' exonuclease domain-containing protein n=1 Tax=Blepharisma stoltei TaxID=1481888 RepID=A0AAU9IFJ7_9CILI|nr:unnamed protein product [Blepharisma stoltei]
MEDLRENLDEEFYEKISSNPEEAATYLINLLKNKETTPDDLFNQFYLAFTFSTQDITSQAISLLKSLYSKNAQAIISKKLIKALIEVSHPQPCNKSSLGLYVAGQWREFDPECLSLLFEISSVSVQKEELISYASQLWKQKNFQKAVKMSRELGISRELDQIEKAIPTLVQKSDIELINILVGTDHDLVRQAVELMCTNKHIKYAGKLVQKAGMDPTEFPDMMSRLKKVAMRYHIQSGEIGVYNLADIVSNDLELLSILIEDLEFKFMKKNIEWMGPLAAELFLCYPGVASQIRPETVERLRKIPPRAKNSSDRFGPLQPEFSISINLPQEQIKFIENEDQVQELVWAGRFVGLDCEWKPSMVKFSENKVALLQIAFEDVVYLIDMIKLNTSELLNAKLEELFLNEEIVKLGISFSGDIKNVLKSYPNLTSFKVEFRPYVELLDLYMNIYGESAGGLAGLCELVLGRSLCKGEQMSNWERRPLKLSQMHYAALDAHILIEIYKTLSHIGETGNIGRGVRVEKSCENCNSKLHMKKQCTRGQRCQICQLFGHIARDCVY